MPVIPVNLADVPLFEGLPNGTYLGDIGRPVFKAARQVDKFPQIQVPMTVVEGDLLGKKQSQFVSLSPNAKGRLKRFFKLFGYGDSPNLVVDDETDELTEPDLEGFRVIFTVKQDGQYSRTEIISVEDGEAAPAVQPARVAVAARPTPVVRPAARVAAPVAVAEPEPEPEPEPEAPAAAVTPRRIAPRPAAAPQPQRRTLR